MIRFERVTITYPDAAAPALADIDVTIPEGELCLVVGETGSGKSTLLKAINGLVPHFTGGRLAGRVVVEGRSTQDHPPRELADVVGYVGQVPAAGFVADTVEHELAFVMENLGVPPAAMRRRVEDVLDLLAIHEIRNRPLETLSGGQQQRVAIAAALAASPPVLVLDEPTSALDPAAAEDVLAATSRLVHDLGVTVLAAEHRLERVVHVADAVVRVDAGGRVGRGDVGPLLAGQPMAPAVVRLGWSAGWAPLPLSVRDARRAASVAAPGGMALRDELACRRPGAGCREPRPPGPAVVDIRRLTFAYGSIEALHEVDLQVRSGEILALMGRNGSGKSTLMAQIAGLHRPAGGSVTLTGGGRNDVVRLVPQESGTLLFEASVRQECDDADHDARAPRGTTAALFEELLGRAVPASLWATHPRDLSEGQRLLLALAVMLVHRPSVLLLDEPTRGLDYAAKERLGQILGGLADDGVAVVMATHDVEVVAGIADRAVVLADGEVVADGSAREVVAHSPVFAPQVAKILAPGPWLTPAEVAAALASPPVGAEVRS